MKPTNYYLNEGFTHNGKSLEDLTIEDFNQMTTQEQINFFQSMLDYLTWMKYQNLYTQALSGLGEHDNSEEGAT